MWRTMYEGDRIVTVTTLRDTPERVERFVERTLRSGVDHMVVFLDAPQPRVAALLEGNPAVSVVRTDAEYWAGGRPDAVVDRHTTNANVACTALADVPAVRWLFHIDSDEVLAFDRDDLLALDARSVRFRTLEAVARRRWLSNGPPWFKRQPSDGELHALAALGYIETPEMRSFYRGHSLGRPGVKPAERVRFRTHTAFELPDDDLPTVVPRDMHVLRYESWCLSDFIERWQGVDPAKARQRPFDDRGLGAAFHLYFHDEGRSEEERRRLVAGLYDEYVADDPEPLRKFDLLVKNPLRRARRLPLSQADVAGVDDALAALRTTDKSELRSPAEVEARTP
jgi:hypothetical protein